MNINGGDFELFGSIFGKLALRGGRAVTWGPIRQHAGGEIRPSPKGLWLVQAWSAQDIVEK